jgi:hypothetical protein
MGILTLEHEGWELDIEYYVDGENHQTTMSDPEERAELLWEVQRVVQAGTPGSYPTNQEITEAVVKDNAL